MKSSRRYILFISVQDTIENLNVECTVPSTTAATTSTSAPTTCFTEVETQSVNQITITAREYVKSFTIDSVKYGGDVGALSFMYVDYNIKLAQERVCIGKYNLRCRFCIAERVITNRKMAKLL